MNATSQLRGRQLQRVIDVLRTLEADPMELARRTEFPSSRLRNQPDHKALAELVTGLHAGRSSIGHGQRAVLSLVRAATVEFPEAPELAELESELRELRGDGQCIILYLGTALTDSDPLDLGGELEHIYRTLRQSRQREALDLRAHWSLSATQISPLLNHYEPAIVHFGGHGGTGGLLLRRHGGLRSQLATPEQLEIMFTAERRRLRCVVLLACHSVSLAQALQEHVDVVIGVEHALGDECARAFSGWFYEAIGDGLDLRSAFETGTRNLELAPGLAPPGAPAQLHMFHRPGVDPSEIRLVRPG
jgi:hypothetical protein